MVSIDVESLYTSIPRSIGIHAVEQFLELSCPESEPQNEFLVELLDFTLSNNVFQFLTFCYHQIRCTSLGAAWAPAYACLHLVPRPCTYVVAVHRRCIDVMEGYLSLHQFMKERNIQLTYNFDQKKLSFLDLPRSPWKMANLAPVHSERMQQVTIPTG